MLSFQQVALNEDPPPQHTHTPIQVTPAFHFSMWSVSNGTDGWTLDTQTESRGYLPKQCQKAQREERDREASKGTLKSHLLHVLECLTLNFLAFYSYVTHTLSPPTPTAWHATLITNVFQTFISSSWEKLHLFSSSRWQGKQRGEDKLEVRKTKKSLSACKITDKLIIQKQRKRQWVVKCQRI